MIGSGLKRIGNALRRTKHAQTTTKPDIAKLWAHVDAARKRAAGSAQTTSDILAKMRAATPIKKVAFAVKLAEMAARVPGGISMAHGAKRLAQQAMALKNRVARKTPHLSALPAAERFSAFAMENPGVAERSKKLHRAFAGTSGLAAAKASKTAAAWQRKEGKNPEGGLNAKGRASLRAQGHNIKRPVSSREAARSPAAAARRKSFCARMSGMPGPMKDNKGRPTRKALSLRKWDC